MTATRPTPLAASRLALAGAFGVLMATTVVALAPRQWAIVTSMAVTEGVPLGAWLLAAFGFGSLMHSLFRGTGVAARDESTLALVTTLALGLGVISLVTLLLGLLAKLDQPTAIAVIAVGDILAFVRIYKHRNTVAEFARESPGASWLLLLLAPVAAIALIGTCVLPGLLWGVDDPAGYDVVAYHLQLPREWYELGRVTTLTHNVFSFFPLNVEMHYLLAMHLRGGPWAGMYLAQMMHGSFVALTIAAVYGAARRRGRLAACVAAIVCASVPWMAMLGSVAYVEGGLMLYTTLAAACAIRGRWALAGACAGLAAGCKLTGVPCAIVLVTASGSLSLWERALPRSKDNRGAAGPRPSPLPGGEGAIIRSAIAFALLATLLLSPWLIRTAIASGGNPVFPLVMRTLGAGHFDAGQVERFVAAHSPRPDQDSMRGRLDALWTQVGGDYHFGAIEVGSIDLPLWLMLIVPAIVLARRDREAWLWLGLICGNVLVWLFATHLQGRFLVQITPCVALVVACAARRIEADEPIAYARPDRKRSTVIDYAVNPSVTGAPRFAITAIVVSLFTLIVSGRQPLATLLKVPGPIDATGFTTPAELRGLLGDGVAGAVYDTDRPIALLGDAKAFWYVIPSSRLRYRSVFDVASTKNFRDAWLGDDVPAEAAVCGDWREFCRLNRTYRRLPDVPRGWIDLMDGPTDFVFDVPR